ncbi:MAG: ADP-ribosylglycohydrolase family protein [Saprospiraceae bacterium]|nr:ADP-ribosylglycohydrolase family protein [Saprospiraceae bacterium]
MIGAIIGDVIGSRFEWHNVKSTQFELFTHQSRFTDDSVLTIAIADSLLNGKTYEETVKSYGNRYPLAGYGGRFKEWLAGIITGPYNSWGNGSAMRVSAIAYAFESEGEVLEESKKSAEITHNHAEGIKGAQAIAMSVFMARKGHTKSEIKAYVEKNFDYDLDRTMDEIRPTYKFDVSCQGSVPEAIIAFLESTDFEHAIRLAISIGGDSDTIASMAGAIAEPFYETIPQNFIDETRNRLPAQFIEIIDAFSERYLGD